jgi:hypothetical protein
MTKTFAIAIAVAMLLAASLAATPDSGVTRPDLRLAQGIDIQIGPDRDGGYRRRSDSETVSIGHVGVTVGPHRRENGLMVRTTAEHPTAEPGFPNVAAKTRVDRSRKSDRLTVNYRGGALSTTIVPKKTVVVPNHSVQRVDTTSACPETLQIDEKKHAPKLDPAPVIDCEGPASPASDPTLNHFIGRCFA